MKVVFTFDELRAALECLDRSNTDPRLLDAAKRVSELVGAEYQPAPQTSLTQTLHQLEKVPGYTVVWGQGMIEYVAPVDVLIQLFAHIEQHPEEAADILEGFMCVSWGFQKLASFNSRLKVFCADLLAILK